MASVFETLKERGLIAQMTHEEKIKEILENEKVTFYIGFDPTADSLHIGHFLQMVVMSHMQKAGHRPIAILGGGTTMIGDPTGKTDMRRMMTQEEIQKNADNFKKQLSKFIEFGEDKALMLNNADWILGLNYIEFLRDIGVHFSVNRMLTAECFKSRLERGLSFIEFNYMLMQSYDFYKLNTEYGCRLELGGDDQWSNILGGIDLVRRKNQEEVYGMTFTLLTNSEGKKMGKTEKGALWLDPNKTSPYEFYQYFRNVGDQDVIRCMKLITFMEMDEIREYEKLEGQELNRAKERLAYEVTKMVHGEEEANKAQEAAIALFKAGGVSADMPTKELEDFGDEIGILDLLATTGIVPSKGEARRLIQQNGLSLGDDKVTDPMMMVTKADFEKEGFLIVKKGKKAFFKVVIKG
ncbi:MAG: tyrosine--tRNA ligase [Clostridia bacterium]|nr:tyrosine--tRNA ligase [Clostridia bacterium]